MIGIKSKKDAIAAIVMLVFLLGFLYLVFFVSGWWVMSAPVFGLAALFVSVWIGTGKVPTVKRENGTTITTSLLTVGGELKSCKVIVQPERILVKSKGYFVEIQMEALSTVMFEDKTTEELPMAGFGIDYRDSDGSARVMFFNQGAFAVRRTRKTIALIQTAHKDWLQGHKGGTLTVLDVSSIKKQIANSVVHRLP